MKCDRCDNEATVTEVTRRGGVLGERHLCERCAAQAGLLGAQAPLVMPAEPPPAPPEPKPAAGTFCPGCGLTLAEFRKSGMAGCAQCYKALESHLSPLIERAHEGATHHVGKVPKRLASGARAPEQVVGGRAEQAERLKLIRRQLDEAVRAEQYERAASLRDELRRLSGPTDPIPDL